MHVQPTVIWAGLTILLGIVEAATVQLVTIWFAIGALVAFFAALFHAPLWLQIILFVLVSALSLIATRPLAKRLVKTDKVPTNADRVIGKIGTVQEDICNEKACGTVLVDGAVWSARSSDGSVLPSGTTVCIERIEGVKVIVKENKE